MKKLLAAENIMCVLFVPVLIFLMSRMISFFFDAWGVEINAAAGIACFAALFLCVLFFRHRIYLYLEDHAYGFAPRAVLIYILSCLAAFRCRLVFIGSCRSFEPILCIAGAGLLLGAFVLILIKDCVGILESAAHSRIKKRDVVFIIAAAAVLNLQAVIYCRFMRQIFIWDNAGYFTAVHRLNEIFPSLEYFRQVYCSVFESDYNYIIAIPASIMCRLFGKSRLVFVLSIINFYLLPLIVILSFGAKKLFGSGFKSVLCVLLCVPYLVFAADTGFIDIGGAVPALAAAMIYLYGHKKEGSLLGGVLLAVCVLMRRWYSFYALSFIIMCFAESVPKRSFSRAVHVLCGFAFTLLFFTQEFVTGKLMADYRGMYSAYALGLRTDLLLFTRYFGAAAAVLLSIYAVVRQAAQKKRSFLCPELFMLLQALLCFALFTSVQTHGQQHLALYVPCFCILLLSLCGAVSGRRIFSAAVFVLCALQTVSIFLPRVQPGAITEIKGISAIPSFSAYPPVDDNTDVILEAAEYLDGEIGMTGKTACILSSSLKLNYDSFKNAEASLSVRQKYDINRESYLLPVSEVDARDGLSDTLFDADFVVVPSPLQLHLDPNAQKTISVPYIHITEGTGFGEKYEKTDKSFELPDGTAIYIYRRTEEITSEERRAVYDEIFVK
ncbi:MAG: hypothetical protein J6N52_07895 [Clostridia bacterium]|nr:hypothetical protein [Clostridia bacterium]